MILDVKELVKVFNDDGIKNTACDGVSFKIAERECLGLIGESGCGKSTTANMIAGMLKPDGGSICYEGTLLEGTYRKQQKLRSNMQMIFQNPQASFNPRMKLRRAITEPLRLSGVKYSRAEREKLLDNVLAAVGLKPEYKDKYAWEISGGECQRAAIARAMICQPKFLICDEITSALDVSIQAQIIQLIYDLKNSSNISFLFISHDLAVVCNICDKIAVMYQGNIVEYGVAQNIIDHPRHPYTRNLTQSALRPGEAEIRGINADIPEKNGCKYYPHCNQATEECLRRVNIVDIDSEHSSACIYG